MVGRVTHSFTHSLAWPLFLSPLMPGPGLWLDQMAQRVLLLPDLEWGQEKGFGSVPEWGTVSWHDEEMGMVGGTFQAG